MPDELLWSPFDALGLDPGRGPYSNEDIERAFRMAAKACHPDRRSRPLWPSFIDLDYARSVLKRDQESARAHFSDYPRTFFPDRKTNVTEPFVSTDFMTCVVCHMPMRINHQSRHRHCQVCEMEHEDMTKHRADFHTCSWCNLQDICSLRQHFSEQHRVHLQETSDARFAQEVRDRRQSWRCLFPGCSSILLNSGRIKQAHLVSHGWAPCEDCDVRHRDFGQHLTTHVGLPCPICQQVQAKGHLWAHLRNKHDFTPCALCPFDEAEIDASHIQETHGGERCRTCSALIDRSIFRQHCEKRHGKVVFPCCDVLFEKNTSLGDHIAVDHPDLAVCPKCSDILPAATMESHKIQHDSIEYPCCGALGLRDDWHTHMNLKHPEQLLRSQSRANAHTQRTVSASGPSEQTVTCELCSVDYKIAYLPKHKRKVHRVGPILERPNPKPKVETQYKECECGLRLLKVNLSRHRRKCRTKRVSKEAD